MFTEAQESVTHKPETDIQTGWQMGGGRDLWTKTWSAWEQWGLWHCFERHPLFKGQWAWECNFLPSQHFYLWGKGACLTLAALLAVLFSSAVCARLCFTHWLTSSLAQLLSGCDRQQRKPQATLVSTSISCDFCTTYQPVITCTTYNYLWELDSRCKLFIRQILTVRGLTPRTVNQNCAIRNI